MNRFPKLTRRWFYDQGVPDPDNIASEWDRWYAKGRRNRTRNTMVRKALQLATGLTRAAIDYYFHPECQYQLAEPTIHRLDEICEALGEPLPVTRATTSASAYRSRGRERLAVFLDLDQPPSPRFHLECLNSVLSATARYNYSVSLHQLSTDDHEQLAHVAHAVRFSKPEGVVWFRITPRSKTLEHLSRQRPPIPTVVVYAARLQYPNTLAHIVPSQRMVRGSISDWARSLRGSKRTSYVVLAHMPRELETYDLSPIPGQSASVRNERIDLIRKGVEDAGIECRCFEISDYAAANAPELVTRFHDALGWVCLSDELSIGALQLLSASGVRAARRRVIGFDDSALARKYGISSFTQHLPDIGEFLVETFAAYFRAGQEAGSAPQEFIEKTIPVELIAR